jgi:hypothetical protein
VQVRRLRLTYVYRPRAGATTQSSEADYESIIFGGDSDTNRIGREVLRYVSIRVLACVMPKATLASARSPLRRLLSRISSIPRSWRRWRRVNDATDDVADHGVAMINKGIGLLTQMVGDVPLW